MTIHSAKTYHAVSGWEANAIWYDAGFAKGRWPMVWGALCYDPINNEIVSCGGSSDFSRRVRRRVWRWFTLCRKRYSGAETSDEAATDLQSVDVDAAASARAWSAFR